MEKRYCTWLIDGGSLARLPAASQRHRGRDLPKSGTTWMQRILSLLIFRSEEPLALDRTFPWWEVNRRPLEALVEDFEARAGVGGRSRPTYHSTASVRHREIHPRVARRSRCLHVVPQSLHRLPAGGL